MQEKIRPGYKQTEVGVIPEDWEVKLLPQAMEFIGGKAHERHIQPYGKFSVVNSKFISSEGRVVKYSNINFCSARRGDILMVMSDLPNGKALAKCFLVEESDRFAVNQRVCILRPRNSDSRFFYYQLNRNPYFLAFDDGVQQTHLLNGVFRACPVIVPPSVVEQTAIADALSDADARIAALEALIAKKRDLKQAAMQHLLTGKTRLPGFSGDWEEKRLGDLISAIGDGGTPATSNLQNFGGGVHWVVIDDIKPEIWTTKNSLSEAGLARCSAKLWPAGTLILSTGATIGEVGIARIPVATKQGICGIVFDPRSAHVQFMKYWFSLNRPLLLSKAQGSTIFEVRPPTLVKIEGLFPEVVEQTAIAEILFDMDAELASLEAEADKARTIKQGMMQNLLTGKVRLV